MTDLKTLTAADLALPTDRAAADELLYRLYQYLPDEVSFEACGASVTAEKVLFGDHEMFYRVHGPVEFKPPGSPTRYVASFVDLYFRTPGEQVFGQHPVCDLRSVKSGREASRSTADTLHMLLLHEFLETHPGVVMALGSYRAVEWMLEEPKWRRRLNVRKHEDAAAVHRQLLTLAMEVSPEFTSMDDAERKAAEDLAQEWTGSPMELAQSVIAAVRGG